MNRPLFLTMGNFDGVHRGHQEIIHTLKTAAAAAGATTAVYTFDPHPVKVLAPERPFVLLQTLEQKLATLAKLGIDTTIVENFTPDFAHLSAREFFQTIVLGKLCPKEIYIGYDFTFGLHREGDTHLLQELGKVAGVPVTIIAARFEGETLFSSSAIRQLVSAGQVAEAAKLLGRPLTLIGQTVPGRGLGRQLGFATANLSTVNECLPPAGIYVTRFGYDHIWEPAVTYIGTNPTHGGTALAIETHVLSSVPELLGKAAQVQFLERVRGELKFKSPEALVQQITADCQVAIQYHATHGAVV